jgi:hypothetical protein
MCEENVILLVDGVQHTSEKSIIIIIIFSDLEMWIDYYLTAM